MDNQFRYQLNRHIYNYLNDVFVYPDEYYSIKELMKKEKYRVLIIGPPGSGKTTLITMLSHLVEDNNTCPKIIQGRNYFNEIMTLGMDDNYCVFVDGIDEIQNPNVIIKSLFDNKCKKVICTARLLNSYRLIETNEYFQNVIKLNSLSNAQIYSFIKRLDMNNSDLIFEEVLKHQGNSTTRDIIQSILSIIDSSNLQKFYSTYDNFLYQHGQRAKFGSGFVFRETKPVIPTIEQISNVNVIQRNLLRMARGNPAIIHNFTPREFEEMVCQYLESNGYSVKLTKPTRDGGKDIIVVQKSILGEFPIYVECKKNDPNRPVGVSIVRELYGTITADIITAGMLVTTSRFTDDAKRFTEKIKHRMTLMDYTELVRSLSDINSI